MRLIRRLLPCLALVLACLLCQADAPEERVLKLLCWTEYVPASVTDGLVEAHHRESVGLAIPQQVASQILPL